MALRLFRAALLFLVASGLSSAEKGLQAAWFIRGDIDSSESFTLADPVRIINFLFLGETGAVGCLDAADVDDSGAVELTDAIYLLNHLFFAGPRPGAQDLFPGCWFDATPDALDCAGFEACNPVGLFFTIQRSGTIRGTPYQVAQREVIRQITELSEEDQLAVVFFDANIIKFPASGRPGVVTADLKASAIALVSSVQPGSGTCHKPALFLALQYATESTSRRKIIVSLGNGLNTCAGQSAEEYGRQLLLEVASRNTGHFQIHTIGLGGTVNEDFLRDLAAQNGGFYARIDR